jgi:hypothetical protein
MSFLNTPLAIPWPPGGVLWIVWEAPTSLSGGQGLGIDNLVFSTGTQPALAIHQISSSINLDWPQMFANYFLQSNTNLANTNGWQTVTQAPTVKEGINNLVLLIGSSSTFFRLKSN